MKDKREEAIDLMKNAQYGAAVPLFLDLLESESSSISIHYMLGQCYKFNGQLSEAIESLEKSKELMKGVDSSEWNKHVYLALGIAYQHNKEFDKAVEILKKGISICPQEWDLHNSLGLTYDLMNNLREAVNTYTKAQEIIVATASKQDYKEIEEEDGTKGLFFDPGKTYLTLQSSPEYCTVLNNIGGSYLKAGDLESAEKAFKESIEFIPDGFNYPPPHDGLAIVNKKRNA